MIKNLYYNNHNYYNKLLYFEMFDELKSYTDKLINFEINEYEYFDYIDDLINSHIINDQYILDIKKMC